ncbi:uncharacterized protein LOC124454957 [Xenia sp. Carnegie-2017]|uniref:uncharacterized protein LOC124454957 n=1 Tax=Xenia sp. Carnegie-2017 TaxID=2897299 RepID=UPI001F04A4D4|nr:uncharacterized protein LOC124454957 [Xenia sp. Carnegie-2017]
MTSVGQSVVSVHNTTDQRTRRKYFLPLNNTYLDLAVAKHSTTPDSNATSTFNFPLCGPNTYYRKINGTLNCTCMEGYSGECNSCQGCPSDWLHIESSCYFFSAKGATWNKARKLCQQKEGDLAVPKNNVENNAIQNVILRKGAIIILLVYIAIKATISFTQFKMASPVSHHGLGENLIIIGV